MSPIGFPLRVAAERALAIERLTGRAGSPSTGGAGLMGLARSTFLRYAPVHLGVDELVARIGRICHEFECYGYRRVGAALRHQGALVKSRPGPGWISLPGWSPPACCAR